MYKSILISPDCPISICEFGEDNIIGIFTDVKPLVMAISKITEYYAKKRHVITGILISPISEGGIMEEFSYEYHLKIDEKGSVSGGGKIKLEDEFNKIITSNHGASELFLLIEYGNALDYFRATDEGEKMIFRKKKELNEYESERDKKSPIVTSGGNFTYNKLYKPAHVILGNASMINFYNPEGLRGHSR
jgi:hypothetical protein